MKTLTSPATRSTNHSSKNVVIPLVVPRRVQILNAKPMTGDTEEIRVRIIAEEGFDPQRDIDLKSLKFGAPEQVDFGKGCSVIESEAASTGLIVTFAGRGNGITEYDFAAKLLGCTKTGGLLLGYSSLPGK